MGDWSRFVGASVLAIAGASIAGLYSFRGTVPVVMPGIALTVPGYQLIHYGCHGDGLAWTLSNHEFGGSSTETVLD